MIAMLWAQQIMLSKKTFEDVPRLLKDRVKEILIESGFENLAEDLFTIKRQVDVASGDDAEILSNTNGSF